MALNIVNPMRFFNRVSGEGTFIGLHRRGEPFIMGFTKNECCREGSMHQMIYFSTKLWKNLATLKEKLM